MAEELLGPSWDGGVILDIGADVGALVLHASASMLGREIELIPDDPDVPRTHSAVRARHLSVGRSFAAVYPHVTAGRYGIEGTDQRVVITGGRVSEVQVDEWSP